MEKEGEKWREKLRMKEKNGERKMKNEGEKWREKLRKRERNGEKN